jgi:hypothetical protein
MKRRNDPRAVTDVRKSVLNAQAELARSNNRAAARLAAHALKLATTRDDVELVRGLAQEGHMTAGRLRRRRWTTILRQTDTRLKALYIRSLADPSQRR